MTVNVGVIGTGNIGQDHIRRLSGTLSGARVVAVTDIDAVRAESVTAALPGARAVPRAQELITAADVDAVVVTSWGPTHEEYVLASIAAGKPVFCEKPLATTADACLRIVDAEQAHGSRLVQIGFMRRYDPGYRAMREVVTRGGIGAPLVVHCAHRNPSVPESYTSDMAVTDTAIHELDTLRWLLDEDFSSAQVLKAKRTTRAAAHLADPQILLLETVSGVRIDIEVFVNCAYGYDIGCEVVGEFGVVRLSDPVDVAVRRAGGHTVAITQDWRDRFGRAFDVEMQEWVDSVAAGHLTGPSSWDGYAAAVTADALLEAARENRVAAVSMKDRPDFYA
jgi:myo-inositol 2-dehydrogenase/D-chiro-inositol 1-dehydrogenase